MGIVKVITKVGVGASATVMAVTALPIAGAVGTITATGATVAAIVGGAAGVVDYIFEDKNERV